MKNISKALLSVALLLLCAVLLAAPVAAATTQKSDVGIRFVKPGGGNNNGGGNGTRRPSRPVDDLNWTTQPDDVVYLPPTPAPLDNLPATGRDAAANSVDAPPLP